LSSWVRAVSVVSVVIVVPPERLCSQLLRPTLLPRCLRAQVFQRRIFPVTMVRRDRPLDSAEMAAWHAFIRAHARVVRLLEAELEAEQGLSLPAYEVLAHLSEAPQQRLRMSDLAALS